VTAACKSDMRARFFSGNYSGTSSGNAMTAGNMISGTATSSGTMSATATPMYRYSRTVAFQARLSDPKSGAQSLGRGRPNARGRGSVHGRRGQRARDAASAILNDLQEKGPDRGQRGLDSPGPARSGRAELRWTLGSLAPASVTPGSQRAAAFVTAGRIVF